MANFGERFRRLIKAHGPISVARFMGESNAHYYASRDPLGAPNQTGGGDFITAPDISQMFGELIGLALAEVWLRAGSPADALYAELGPGRGTLARDALRAMAVHGCKPEVHLVEGSPVLRAVQAKAVPHAQWHSSSADLPGERPLLLVANEFFDALAVRQLVKTESGWRERMVALDENENFVFAAGLNPMDDAVPDGLRAAATGAVIETSPASAAIMTDLAQQISAAGGAGLIADYGAFESRMGSTLQAVRGHQKVDVLRDPGTADLTAHVDFEMLSAIARAAGLEVHCAAQGEWLTAMGIDLRQQALAKKFPARAEELAAAQARLVDPYQMGELFKVMAITAPEWGAVAGFGE